VHQCTVAEALELFHAFYNRQFAGGTPSFTVIHGYGSSGEGGRIRKALRAFLEGFADTLTWKTGEELDGNPGCTVVYPKKPLPSTTDLLGVEILRYCSVPRTEDKIVGEFHRHGQRQIKESIRRLKQQSRLREIFKGAHKMYQSVLS